MAPTHPFVAKLATVDPATRLITLDDVAALGDDEPLNVTILNMSAAVSVDMCLWRAAQERLTVTSAPGYRGPPVVFIGSGVGDDGTVAPYFLGIEPCLCPRDAGDGRHWNPLILTLLWHRKLPSMIGSIASAYQRNIAAAPERYCEDGLAVLLAAFRNLSSGTQGHPLRTRRT